MLVEFPGEKLGLVRASMAAGSMGPDPRKEQGRRGLWGVGVQGAGCRGRGTSRGPGMGDREVQTHCASAGT